MSWKVTSFRECQHSRDRRHLRWGVTVATARIWLTHMRNGGAIYRFCGSELQRELLGRRDADGAAATPSCRATEMQMEPQRHRAAAGAAPPPSCSVSHRDDGTQGALVRLLHLLPHFTSVRVQGRGMGRRLVDGIKTSGHARHVVGIVLHGGSS